jgi:hypothetical protein
MAGKNSIFADNQPPSADAAYLNLNRKEINNIITGTGQTLNDAIDNQAAISIAQQSANNFYIDSGSANDYVLTLSSSFTSPVSATVGYFTGMEIKFRAGNAGTGIAAIVNVGNAGNKSLKEADGVTNPSSIPTTEDSTFRFDGTVFRKINAVAQATESAAGIAEIATNAEVAAGTDDTTTITPLKLAAATSIIKLGTAVASTSGASIDFTSIPDGVKKITVMFDGISTTGTSIIIVQIGDSGGVEATGYAGAATTISSSGSTINYSTGFGLAGDNTPTYVLHGSIEINLLDGTTWTAAGNLGNSTSGRIYVIGGSKSLSATLDRVRITTVGGSNTFDAGTINIQYQ